MASLSFRFAATSRWSLYDWLPRLTRFGSIPSFGLTPAALAIPLIQNLIDLFPPFLLAVPKKKVSHSRKSMRSANKGLKDKTNIVNCQACGSPKLAHNLCGQCYSQLNRGWKAEDRAKQAGGALQPVP